MSTDNHGPDVSAGARDGGAQPSGEAGEGASAEDQHRKDFSAGGVVVRDDDVIVIEPRRRGSQGGKVLGLPKGHPDGDETDVEAATREVREETGVVADPVVKLGEISYSYERRGRPVDKRVVFFLFEYRSGDLSHDHEIANVQWMPMADAVRELTYSGEREMVARALSRRGSDL